VPPQDGRLLGDGVCRRDDTAVRIRHARQACTAPLCAERGWMRGGLGMRQLSECFAWFYIVLGDAPGSSGSSAVLLSCPRLDGSPTFYIDGTTACLCQGTFPDYDRSSCLLSGMASNSAARQHSLTSLHEGEGVRFPLRSLKQANESGEVDEINIRRTVSADRTAATVRLARKKAVLELVGAGDHAPILGNRGALTGTRVVVGNFLQSLPLFHGGGRDDAADVSGGGGDDDGATAALVRCLLGLVLTPRRAANRYPRSGHSFCSSFALTVVYNTCHVFASIVIRLPVSLLDERWQERKRVGLRKAVMWQRGPENFLKRSLVVGLLFWLLN
jgi:hypothetical protein